MLAAHVSQLTGARGSGDWGLDHGAWSVLRSLFPDADVPVVQFSLDRNKSAAEHYAAGSKLAALRDDGVMILGSGNIVHNLRYFRGPAQLFPRAKRFDDAVIDRILTNDHLALIDYTSLDEEADLSVPTDEHFIPLLYVIGAKDQTECAEIFCADVLNSISMTSVAYGV